MWNFRSHSSWFSSHRKPIAAPVLSHGNWDCKHTIQILHGMTKSADDVFLVGDVSFLPAESVQNRWLWDVQADGQMRFGILFTRRIAILEVWQNV